MTCSVSDCEHAALVAGLCRGHYERKRRGKSLDTPLRQWGDPVATHRKAILAYADAETDAEFRRATSRVLMAERRRRKAR